MSDTKATPAGQRGAPLPGLVVRPGEERDERLAAFVAEHGRPPEVVLVVSVKDARRAPNDAS